MKVHCNVAVTSFIVTIFHFLLTMDETDNPKTYEATTVEKREKMSFAPGGLPEQSRPKTTPWMQLRCDTVSNNVPSPCGCYLINYALYD